ncbi:MAG TPA: cytochrome c biogenesis protein CcdA, partial [Acidimicrobiales bacterium]|nr:cytochrome c biogenesis protein CcdA [Acidimicrobiales bacterium]
MVSGLSAAELDAVRGASARAAASGASLPVREAATVGGPTPLLAGPAADSRGSGAAEARGMAPDRWRARLAGGLLGFVAGFTVVFVALGASASAIGRLLLVHQRSLEVASGVVIVAFGGLLVALAAGVRLPAAVIGERRLPVRPSLLGSLAAPIMGMAFAFAWTPCIGPVLGSVLALAAGTGGSALGAWAAPVMGMAFAFAWTPCIGPVLGAIFGLAATRSTLAGG